MISGSCHCSSVSWSFDGAPEAATACNCTICRKYGALWIYGTLNENISIVGETSIYRRKDAKALDFHFCPKCRCLIAWRARKAKDGRYACAVNLRLVDVPERVFDLRIRHFDGLTKFEAEPNDQRTVADMWY